MDHFVGPQSPGEEKALGTQEGMHEVGGAAMRMSRQDFRILIAATPNAKAAGDRRSGL